MSSHRGMFGPKKIARWKGLMQFFREMPATGRVTSPCVYIHFDAENRPLYVGYASYIGERMINHERSSPWFSQVKRIKVIEFDSGDEAFEAEQILIRVVCPPYNIQGKPQGASPPEEHYGPLC